MNIADTLSGATRVIAILGDPIAQVKSPAGVTQRLIDRGCNAVVVPIHVTSADLAAFVAGASVAKNFDGMIITVPHKLDSYRLCATATERAHFLGGVNVLRRNADGGWHGDHADGLGFIEAQRRLRDRGAARAARWRRRCRLGDRAGGARSRCRRPGDPRR
jgi:shikimate dehydrogenase